MGKFDIDDILADLGVKHDDSKALARRKRGAPDPEPAQPRHSIDRAEKSFSPLPAVPSGQRSFGTNVTFDNDPSVPVRAPAPPKPAVGEALSNVYDPGESADLVAAAGGGGKELGEFLVAVEAVSAQQIGAAQQVLKTSPGRRLADVLIEQGADEIKVYQAIAGMSDVPFERVDMERGLDGGFDGKLLNRLTPDFCKAYSVLPLRTTKGSGAGPDGKGGVGGRVIIGAATPDDVFLLDEVRRRLGVSNVKLVVVPPSDIKLALELVGQSEHAAQPDMDVSSLLSEVDEDDVQVEKVKESQEVDLEREAAESPVIRYVNYIIQSAVKEGASDIHVEPGEKKLKVRFRIDGNLFEMMTPPGSMSSAITSRLKIMANLDISERRIPQDGRIRCTVHGRKLDLRVSTLPNSSGEKTVMRILDTKSINVDLDALGFEPDTLTVWKRAIDEPHGIVLVTGPTGSGKTTTLYASLRGMDKNTMNVSTVEDPVEYHLDGITQTQVHEKIGMTFAKALKALLRQDPDVIMLGEIRDMETAQTAVQAALTGHLVLSTLHTNDAPSSLTRLVNIGLEPFLVGAAVRAVLAQRLVRRLCPACKFQGSPTEEYREYLSMQGLNPDAMWMPKGCDKCRNRGYSGRVGIYEILAVDDNMRDIIARNPNVSEFRRTCMERGMVTLRSDGMKKVADGLTSVEEVIRATEANI